MKDYRKSGADVKILWDKISQKTRYSVEFKTDEEMRLFEQSEVEEYLKALYSYKHGQQHAI